MVHKKPIFLSKPRLQGLMLNKEDSWKSAKYMFIEFSVFDYDSLPYLRCLLVKGYFSFSWS